MKKRENPLYSVLANILIPSLILFFLAREEYLGPKWGFVLAFAFPLSYGLFDFFSNKKFNYISVLGIVNVLLIGDIGLLKIDNHWFAVKEASIPAIIGLVSIASLKTKYPLIRTIIFNDIVIDTKRVNAELEKRQSTKIFNSLLSKSTIILSMSFFISSVLNYALAKYIVISPPGTSAYNQELGKMTMLSYPVIAVPSLLFMGFAVWYLFKGIEKTTGLNLEEILKKRPKSIS